MNNFVTVVYNFKSEQAQMDMADGWKEIFVKDDDLPVKVTAISHADEITRLDLIEFAHSIADMSMIGEIISTTKLEPYLEIMKKTNDYANEHSVTLDYAYEMLA
jgi:hypothetical protein